MSRTSELLKQPYAMGRDSFIPATPYAAGLQTRQITRQTTGRTPSVATVPAAPVPTKHRTPAEINFDIDQLQKKRKAIMSEAQKLLQQLGPGTEVSDVSIRGEIGKRAKEQYGKAGEFTPQIKALEKELEQSKAAERKRFMEEEGYRDASPLDLTLRSGKQGYFNSIYGQESYKDMLGLESTRTFWRGRSINFSRMERSRRPFPAAPPRSGSGSDSGAIRALLLTRQARRE